MSAPKRFRGYQFTVEDWLALCELHGNRCAHCGEEKPLTVDHIMPRTAGGTDALENIQPLCRQCNEKKNARDPITGKMLRKITPRPFFMCCRITADCKALLEALMARYGISEAAILEQAVREYAEKRGVTGTVQKSE